jgi:hypothetical protein
MFSVMVAQQVHEIQVELQLERIGIYELGEYQTRIAYFAIFIVLDQNKTCSQASFFHSNKVNKKLKKSLRKNQASSNAYNVRFSLPNLAY